MQPAFVYTGSLVIEGTALCAPFLLANGIHVYRNFKGNQSFQLLSAWKVIHFLTQCTELHHSLCQVILY